MDKHKHRYPLILAVLASALLVLAVVSVTWGRYPIPLRELLGILASKFRTITPFWTTQQESILLNVRLPRIALACVVGCCLSAAGAAYQGVFQNPMASPDILGASTGAGLGAALALLFGLGGRMVTLCAFAASVATVALVLFIAKRAQGRATLGLILSGIMVSSLCNAGIAFVKLVADPNDTLPGITYWLMGSLAKTRMEDLLFALVPMLVGLVPLMALRWKLNLLTLNDDEARTMGVNTSRMRMVVILSATLITAASVSVSGVIGWVGLVIPHLARRLVGNSYRHLMPAAMLCGAIFMLAVDDISRNAMATEIPIGILTAFIGAPFFLWLITRKGEVV